MTDKQIKKMETIKKNRRRKYLVKWVLYWGISSAIIFSLINFWILGETDYIVTIISLVLFPISGFFVGLLNWHYFEKKYKENKSNNYY